MDRISIARAIAGELLDNGALDENNFSHDAEAILNYVQKIILEYLKDYIIVSGTIL
jgi:hypothetical protein